MGSAVRHRTMAGLGVALIAVLAVGCGGGSSASSSGTSASSQAAARTTSTAPTQPSATPPARVPHLEPTAHIAPEPAPTNAEVKISSPVVGHGVFPARYTCDGANISPPLHWQGIPAGTAELMLDVLNFEPVDGKLYFGWAVAGINPKSSGVAAGALPPGAVVGVNSAGQAKYSLCPAKTGVREDYIAVLFALPRRLRVKPGFNAAALRLQAERTAQFEGFMFFHDTRR
jgi:phosphatidylethanolamine-binding protein (PEBP) family uncharacterized protein